MAKKAQGFIKWRAFAYSHAPGKNTEPVRELQRNQRLKMSSLDRLATTTTRVDVDRANYRGTLYTQEVDMTPRLVKGQKLMAIPLGEFVATGLGQYTE